MEGLGDGSAQRGCILTYLNEHKSKPYAKPCKAMVTRTCMHFENVFLEVHAKAHVAGQGRNALPLFALGFLGHGPA